MKNRFAVIAGMSAPQIAPAFRLRALACAVICLCGSVPAAGADTPPTEWQVTKCRVYAEALQGVVDDGVDGLSKSFLDENAVFVAKGCTERVPVCPITETDLQVANLLTIVAMNAGTASTFLPFDCAGR